MKKTYNKPVIVFESFTMSTNIASGCENPTNLPSVNQCGIDIEGFGNIFMQGMDCVKKIAEGDSFNGICYHTPTEGNNLFTS